jgi:YhcG PDDEXK nuclease domain
MLLKSPILPAKGSALERPSCIEPNRLNPNLPRFVAVSYVGAVDDILRSPGHNETVGLLLCTAKNERIVRYALGRSTSPMAVSGYRYTELPDDERRLRPGEAELTAVVDAALSRFDAS